MNADSRMLRTALWYARRGYRVFPLHNPDRGLDGKLWCSCGKHNCPSKAKHPRTDHGVKDATTDEQQIRVWWTRWPEANIGIAIDAGILVLDVDLRAAGDMSLAALELEHGRLPETPRAISGSGGPHIWLRLPDGLRVNNSSGALGPGLDIKSIGGYVVAPPSLHISGNRYAWEITAHIKDMPIAEAPQWLLDLIADKSGGGNGQGFRASDHPIYEGEGRNTYLYRLGRSEKARNHAEAVICVAMAAANETQCRPPVDAAEFEKILHSVLTGGDRPDFECQHKDNPWASAKAAAAFIAEGEADVDYLARHILVRSGVTIFASPRGLGKTHVAIAVACAAARNQYFRGEQLKTTRVLYLDRDNPPSDLRRRLRHWGAGEAEALKVLDRNKCPPLTDAPAWNNFPYTEYDLVIIDSFSAATEGIKEKEAGETGKVLAAVLDNARKGPSMLLLANCRKDEGVIRGSGVIGDRADIVYEIRDATELKLEAKHEHWLDALPPSDETQWAAKSKRRKRREAYRLAFVVSKFRVGEEPDPFILEIRLPDEGDWSVIDVTAQVEDELSQLKGEATEARRSTENMAIEALKTTIAERYAVGSVVTATEAVEILHGAGLTRDHARHVRDDLSVGIAARWRREPGKNGGWIFLPHSAAQTVQSQRGHQESTSDAEDVADTGAQGPQRHTGTKYDGENGFNNTETVRTDSVSTDDRERL